MGLTINKSLDMYNSEHILADKYLKQKNHSQALKILKESYDKDPLNPQTNVLLANQYSINLDEEKCNKQINLAIYNNPDLPQIHFMIGKIYHLRNQDQQSIESFKYCLSLDSNQYLAWLYLAEIQRKINDLSASIDSIDNQILLKPLDSVGQYCRGLSMFELKLYENASHDFKKCLEQNELYHEVYQLLGNCQQKIIFECSSETVDNVFKSDDQNINQAILYQDKYIEYNSTKAEIQYLKGNLLKLKANYHESLACQEICLKLNPNHNQAIYKQNEILKTQKIK